MSPFNDEEMEEMRAKKICPICFIQLKLVEIDHRIMWECPECGKRWGGYVGRLPEVWVYDNDDDMFRR